MDQQPVFLVSTGAANLASVQAAFARCGKSTKVVERPDDILLAQYVVLPGVGSFGMASRRLAELGFINPLRERIRSAKPTLAICLGLQLLASGSEEDPDASGLDLLNTTASRINGNGNDVRVPQFGWNKVMPSQTTSLVKPGYAYFANSYVLTEGDESWSPSYAIYGDRFVAAIEYNCVLACQFHPELSGRWGHELLTRWLKKGAKRC